MITKILDKIKNTKPCPLCGSTNYYILYPSTLKNSHPLPNQYVCTTTSYGQHGPIYKCRNCDFIFIRDNNPLKNILDNYEEVEDPIYLSEEAARIKTFSRHLKNINKLSCNKGILLEVGAYTGLFLSMAKKAGWQVKGVEPSKWAVIQAKKHYGLTVKKGILKPGYFRPETFDVVVMWDVIEHIPDPLRDLRTCYSYLKPGGMIVMSTIDINSLAAKILRSHWPWLIDMHRVYFSKSTMRKMLKKVGFTKISFRPHIRFVSIRYLISRFVHINKYSSLPFGNVIIPFYIGDLFDIYAQKPNIK